MAHSCDVLIVGAGPAGLCFAKSLSLMGLSVLIIEKQPMASIAAPAKDGRDIALTHLSRNILNELGMWKHFPEECISTIREARVYNGDSSRFMGLSSSKENQLAFIVPNYLIREAAYKEVNGDKNITILDNMTVSDIDLSNTCVKATLSDGLVATALLMAAADNRFSETRKKVGIPASMHDFGKTMIVCQMSHELPHYGIAHECFLSKHTLAVLPLHGNRSSVIITMRPQDADHIMKLPAAELNLWVAEQFKNRLGKMALDAERHAYPLVGVYADRFTAQRFALVGDAAVGMHPVTAHGFNFGLSGQHRLSAAIKKALLSNSDIGTVDVLRRYAITHRRATRPLYLATNGIASLYTLDSPPAKVVRKILLGAADHMLPFKSLLMRKLTERTGEQRDNFSPIRKLHFLLRGAA